MQHPQVAARLDQLGISLLWPAPPTERHPRGFCLMAAPWGGPAPDIDALPAFASSLLGSGSREMKTLRRQLRDADADERHAFLFVGWEFMEAWPLYLTGREFEDEIELPTSPPVLPEPIDGLWLASMSEQLTRIIAWLPGSGRWIEGPAVRSVKGSTSLSARSWHTPSPPPWIPNCSSTCASPASPGNSLP